MDESLLTSTEICPDQKYDLGFINVETLPPVRYYNKDSCPCGKSASFGVKGTNTRLFCKSCKLPEHVNLHSRRCKCGKVANFGCPKRRKKVSCKSCKSPKHVNLASIHCKCGKNASFGCPMIRKKVSCGSCKLPGHVNLSSRVTRRRK